MASDLAAVRADLAQYTGIPKFQSPGPAIDVGKLRGKSVMDIPATSAIPFNAIIDQNMSAVAKRYGINYTEYANQGEESEWAQGLAQATAKHTSLVNLMVSDPRVLLPQISSARQAGVDVMSSLFFGDTQTKLVPHTVSGTVTVPYNTVARLEADWAISATNDHADVIVVESGDLVAMPPQVATIQAQFKKYCPGCKVTVVNVPNADWATKIQPEVETALVKDPKVNYIIPLVDPMTQFVIPAIRQAGRIGKVFISTSNGTPFALKLLAQHNVIRMDVGQNLEWMAWANMDEAMRILLHKPVVHEQMALRVFSAQNVASTGNPPTYNKGFGNAYIAGYEALWRK